MKWSLDRSDYAALITLVLVAVAGVTGYMMFPRAKVPVKQDYSLPDDVFDSATIGGIWRYYYENNMVGSPQNYEVYMLTGGLGVANPMLGGFTGQVIGFEDKDTGTMFDLQETSKYTVIPSDWLPRRTSSGQVYYKLNDPTQASQYFFNLGQTGFQLVIRPINGGEFPFPQGIIKHLIPIGNPVYASTQ